MTGLPSEQREAVREAIASRNAVGIAAIAVGAWVFGIVLAVAVLVGAR